MNILKKDQKKHAHELHEIFQTIHPCLKDASELVRYFYGEDSDKSKNFYEKAQRIYEELKNILSDIDKKYDQ